MCLRIIQTHPYGVKPKVDLDSFSPGNLVPLVCFQALQSTSSTMLGHHGVEGVAIEAMAANARPDFRALGEWDWIY